MERPMKPKENGSPLDVKSFLAKVDGGRTLSEFRKNQDVFRQGDPADSVFYIQKGKAKLTVTSEQGKEAVVAVLGAGDFFGEGCLGGQTQRIATASTLTDCMILQIPKAEILRVIHNETAFADLFILHLLARNSRVEADLVDQLFNSSEKRLARTLLLLANFGEEKDIEREPVLAKISQATLADIIGTTRARVSFFMNKFRRLGLIDYNGKIVIHPALLDLVLHEKPEIRS
jgi:CRP/FNR family cyclic AMP-dependent transcriptional regulator